MRIDCATVLLDMGGNPLMDGESQVTLKRVAVEVLKASFEDEKDLSGDDKRARYLLGRRISHVSDRDLKSEEIVLLKKLIAKAYGPSVVGPAWLILEGESQTETNDDAHVHSNGADKQARAN